MLTSTVVAIAVSSCRDPAGRDPRDDGDHAELPTRLAIVYGSVSAADGRPVGPVRIFAEAKANGCSTMIDVSNSGTEGLNESGKYSMSVNTYHVDSTFCIVAHFVPSNASGLDSLEVEGGELVFRDPTFDQVYDSLRIDAVLPVKR